MPFYRLSLAETKIPGQEKVYDIWDDDCQGYLGTTSQEDDELCHRTRPRVLGLPSKQKQVWW